MKRNHSYFELSGKTLRLEKFPFVSYTKKSDLHLVRNVVALCN